MYKHHYQTTSRKQDNLMHNIYYLIFGQLVCQDLALYATVIAIVARGQQEGVQYIREVVAKQ
jgi:hypothetical protein